MNGRRRRGSFCRPCQLDCSGGDASVSGSEADDRGEAWVRALVLRSSARRARLRALQKLAPADAWLSAGFVRDPVFDALFGPRGVAFVGDLDVIYLDPSDLRPERDRQLEQALSAYCPGPWQVKNQARMALRNGHGGYADVRDALAYFPETATALATRLCAGRLQLLAPHGLADLFAGIIRVSPPADRARFAERCLEKRWSERWPRVRIVR